MQSFTRAIQAIRLRWLITFVIQTIFLLLCVAVIVGGVLSALLFGLSLGFALLLQEPAASLDLIDRALWYLGAAAGCAVVGMACAPFTWILDG